MNDYNPRVVRDKHYKAHVDKTRTVHALYDLEADPGEQTNLIDSNKNSHQAALKKLKAAVATFPKNDARPHYDPLPPQPWDKKISTGSKPKRERRRQKKTAK